MFEEQTDFPLPLIPREKEIAELISQGETNQDIMEKLFITKHTLKAHIGSLYYKYGLTSRNRKEYSVKRLRFVLQYKELR